MTLKGLHSMMLLMVNKLQKKHDFRQLPFKEFCTYQKEIFPIFRDIFKTNTRKLREAFFKNHLIVHLWQLVFIEARPELMRQYLRCVRSYPHNGELRYDTLITDIHRNELLSDAVLFGPKSLKKISTLSVAEV